MLQGLLDPVRDVGASGDDADAESAIAIGELVGAASEAREEGDGDEVGGGVDGDGADLLGEELDLVAGGCDRGEVEAGDGRDEMPEMAAAIAGDVADDDRDFHRGISGGRGNEGLERASAS